MKPGKNTESFSISESELMPLPFGPLSGTIEAAPPSKTMLYILIKATQHLSTSSVVAPQIPRILRCPMKTDSSSCCLGKGSFIPTKESNYYIRV